MLPTEMRCWWQDLLFAKLYKTVGLNCITVSNVTNVIVCYAIIAKSIFVVYSPIDFYMNFRERNRRRPNNLQL